MHSIYFFVAYLIIHSLSSFWAGSLVQICQLGARPWHDALNLGTASLQRENPYGNEGAGGFPLLLRAPSLPMKPIHSAEMREGAAKCPEFRNINSSFHY